MRQDQQNPLKRFFGSRLFLLIFIPLAVLAVLGFLRSYWNGYKINQEIAQLKSEINSLETKKLESMEILKYVMSDNFVEDMARTELNMKKPGEKVLVVHNKLKYPDRNKSGIGGESSGQKISNPLKWWYYFTNKSMISNGQ